MQMAQAPRTNIRRGLAGAARSVPLSRSRHARHLGRNAAVGLHPRLLVPRLSSVGVWLVVHLIQLIGFRNKLVG